MPSPPTRPPRQVRREFNKVADALSNQAIGDYRSGANPHLWRLEEAVAAAQAAAAAAEGVAEAAAAVVGEEGAGAGGDGGAGGWLRDATAKRPRLE